jgi:NAD(P)-dependent dehydrogenase (short-subunit alcohol dehydrogenase family)
MFSAANGGRWLDEELRLTVPSARTVFILGASSDIGVNLMRRYLSGGATVIGTYRRAGALDEFSAHPEAHLLELDVERPEAFDGIAQTLAAQDLRWDTFIALNGTMEPIGPFLDIDGAAWQRSICANAILPCRLLKALYPYRHVGRMSSAVFFAGGGTNNPFTNYSAYCLSKILLIKMCELLDDEVPDLKSFIVGPGYVRTRIHDETLRAAERSGENLAKTRRLLATEGTSMDDIHACIEWCVSQDRSVVGGRNLSVVHDAWREGGEMLATHLAADPNKFKLRRSGNG